MDYLTLMFGFVTLILPLAFMIADPYIKSWTRHRVIREIVRARAAQGQPLDPAFIRRVMNDDWDEDVDHNNTASSGPTQADWTSSGRACGIVILSSGVGLALAALVATQGWPQVHYAGLAASILTVFFGAGLIIASRGRPRDCSASAAEK